MASVPTKRSAKQIPEFVNARPFIDASTPRTSTAVDMAQIPLLGSKTLDGYRITMLAYAGIQTYSKRTCSFEKGGVRDLHS